MGADVFISHSSLDKKYATWVKDYLEANGISCWMDSTDIHGGQNYLEKIPDAIHDCKFLVLLLSNHSQKSKWVLGELEYALKNDKTVLPFMLENCELTRKFDFPLGTVQHYEAYKDMQGAVEKMVLDIKTGLGRTDYTINYGAQDTLQEQMRELQKGLHNTPDSNSPPAGNGPNGAMKVARIVLLAVLWLLFFPIMLIIKVCRSQGLNVVLKVVISTAILPLVSFWIVIYASIIILMTSTDDGPIISSADQIEIDVQEMVTPFIVGYNNFGYFDRTATNSASTVQDGATYSYRIDFAGISNGDAYFNLSVDKNAAPLGDTMIKTSCNSLLSNTEILEFALTSKISGCNILLTNNKFRISTLRAGEFERDDPKEYLSFNETRNEPYGIAVNRWYTFEVSSEEYSVGTKTVKVFIIDDKRPGAEFVQPGIRFEVYEGGKLLGQGRYIFNEDARVHYYADYDDYKGDNYYPELVPDFDQAVLLDQTGILFNFDSRTYTRLFSHN